MGRALRPGDHTRYAVPLLRRAFPLFPSAFAHPEDRLPFERPEAPVARRAVVPVATRHTWDEPEEARRRLDGLWPQVGRRPAQLPPRHRPDQLDRPASGVGHAEQVDAALEAIAPLARQLQCAPCAADARGLEVGALED